MYAFDVHCNAFFPLFVLLYVVQYFLAPFLLQPTSVAAVFANMLYLVSFGYYTYVTCLGYMTLPFLRRTEILLAPLLALVTAAVLASVFGLNLARVFLLPVLRLW
jgi:hypothetical protein